MRKKRETWKWEKNGEKKRGKSGRKRGKIWEKRNRGTR